MAASRRNRREKQKKIQRQRLAQESKQTETQSPAQNEQKNSTVSIQLSLQKELPLCLKQKVIEYSDAPEMAKAFSISKSWRSLSESEAVKALLKNRVEERKKEIPAAVPAQTKRWGVSKGPDLETQIYMAGGPDRFLEKETRRGNLFKEMFKIKPTGDLQTDIFYAGGAEKYTSYLKKSKRL